MSSGPPKASTSGPRRKNRSGDSSSKKKKTKKTNPVDEPAIPEPTATFGDDFLGFIPSDDDDDTPERGSPKPTREWDAGKPARIDNRGRDRNRQRDHERDDGYANKKQRLNASSRRAPWVDDIEWEDCANVSEMCVSQCVWRVVAPTDWT
jgi:non-canonical poly(A) RNA polymerase PAPD5/7